MNSLRIFVLRHLDFFGSRARLILRTVAMAFGALVLAATPLRAQQQYFLGAPTKYTYAGCDEGWSCHTFELFVGIPAIPTQPGLGSATGAAWRASNTFFVPGVVTFYVYFDDFQSWSCVFYYAVGTCVDDWWGTPSTFPGQDASLLSFPLYGFWGVPEIFSPTIIYYPPGDETGGVVRPALTMPLVSVSVLPEPSTYALFAIGLLGIAIVGRGRRSRLVTRPSADS